MLIVYIPNIIASSHEISQTASAMSSDAFPFGRALYSAFLYGTFQLANVAVFVQHARSFDKPKDAIKSMGIGCGINIIMMTVVVLGIMTVAANPDMANQSMPTLFMVQSGSGSRFLTPLISVLIILGAVSTAVNMVAAMVTRICNNKSVKLANSPAADSAHIPRKEIIAALICCLADFGIAQFGLLTLIQKAYSFLSYLAIPVILIPYVVRMIWEKTKR